jgi:hypothetical protein
MSKIRFTADLALPNPLPTALNNNPTPQEIIWMQNHTWLEIIKQAIVRLKGYASNMQPGTHMEENSTKATYHVCYHDIFPFAPCGPEQDI